MGVEIAIDKQIIYQGLERLDVDEALKRWAYQVSCVADGGQPLARGYSGSYAGAAGSAQREGYSGQHPTSRSVVKHGQFKNLKGRIVGGLIDGKDKLPVATIPYRRPSAKVRGAPNLSHIDQWADGIDKYIGIVRDELDNQPNMPAKYGTKATAALAFNVGVALWDMPMKWTQLAAAGYLEVSEATYYRMIKRAKITLENHLLTSPYPVILKYSA